ncbi:hypothetical protein JTL60_34615, partial [Pseudomonas aeruginosa]|nr:hypothetical protein [Pseudomonas aeruginosa]
MPFAKRGDVVHSEATSGFNNQKKSLLINGLAALGDYLHPLHRIILRTSAEVQESLQVVATQGLFLSLTFCRSPLRSA